MDAESKKLLAFKQAELFSGLEEEVVKALASKAVEKRLARNEILFLAGEDAKGLFLIAEGSVRAFRTNADGREQVIHVEKAISTIAEVPVFDDGTHPSTAAADEPTLVYLIPKNEIRRLCFQYPQIALAATKVFAKRLRRCAKMVEMLSLREVSQRVAWFLAEEALTRGKQTSEGIHFTQKLTHNQLAAHIGTIREVVTRSLHNLQEQKLIIIRDKEVIIPNIYKLKQYADSL
ncbi:MAG: Crp/Fnr family transcriptional regulator [Acidobacteria bacterium]|jgi:CRP/FNR family transcriptional regulator|nr:MAG: Crp/Fnr family transcriptional regulator [Acidobacteriota bacterium]GIU81512.1 MAG: CarD family transcriptional regulator [Pyrinomonadaceae bacterium]